MRGFVFIAMVLMSARALSAQDGFFAVEGTGQRYSSAHDAATLGPIEKRLADLEAKVAAFKSCQCPDMVTEQAPAESPPASQWKIVMESIPNCQACKLVDEKDRPRYIAQGWQWETVHLPGPMPGARGYPRFLLCNGVTCQVVEIENTSQLDSRIRDAIGKLLPPYSPQRLKWNSDYMDRHQLMPGGA